VPYFEQLKIEKEEKLWIAKISAKWQLFNGFVRVNCIHQLDHGIQAANAE